jgi:hypothetical protein
LQDTVIGLGTMGKFSDNLLSENSPIVPYTPMRQFALGYLIVFLLRRVSYSLYAFAWPQVKSTSDYLLSSNHLSVVS